MATTIDVSKFSALVATSAHRRKKCFLQYVQKKKFALSNRGKRAIISHMTGKAHKGRIAATNSVVGISTFNSRTGGNSLRTYVEVSPASTTVSTSEIALSTSQKGFFYDNEIRKLNWFGSSALSAQRQVSGLKRNLLNF